MMAFTNEFTETLTGAQEAGWKSSSFTLDVIFEGELAHSAKGYCAEFNCYTWGKGEAVQISLDTQEVSFCSRCIATSRVLYNGVKGETQASELITKLKRILNFEHSRINLESQKYVDFPGFEDLEKNLYAFSELWVTDLDYYQDWLELIKVRLMELKKRTQTLDPQDLKDLIEECVYYLVPTFEDNLLNFPEVVAGLEEPRERARQSLREDKRWAVFTLGKLPARRECPRDAFNAALQHFMVNSNYEKGERLLYAPLVVCEFMRETGLTKDWSLAPSGLPKSSLEALWVLHYADSRGVYSDMKTALDAAISL